MTVIDGVSVAQVTIGNSGFLCKNSSRKNTAIIVLTYFNETRGGTTKGQLTRTQTTRGSSVHSQGETSKLNKRIIIEY
jgi:hypothetical protein